MLIFPAQPQATVSLQGATLIVPALAAGNVGELAVDALLATLITRQAAELVARLEDDLILPIAGNGAYVPPTAGRHVLHTALELYQVKSTSERPVFILQQRAPPRKGCQKLFAERLAAFAQSRGVASLLVLCGLTDPALRRSEATIAHPFRYWAANADSDAARVCQGLQWERLETELYETDKQAHSLLPPWTLLDAAHSTNTPTLLLSMFASEGNNEALGMQLAQHTVQWLQATGTAIPGPAGAQTGQGPGQGAGDSGVTRLVVPWSWQCGAVYA